MNNEIKEIYLSNLEWTKTHDNIGGVMCNLIFKDNMSYEDYQKLFKTTYFVLCNKDYITNLQEENRVLKELNVCVGCENNPNYKSRNEKAIEYINENICDIDFMKKEYGNHFKDYDIETTFKDIENLLNILGGDE